MPSIVSIHTYAAMMYCVGVCVCVCVCVCDTWPALQSNAVVTHAYAAVYMHALTLCIHTYAVMMQIMKEAVCMCMCMCV